jgi:hypothetical protein
LANQLSDLQYLIRQLGPSLPEISTIIEEDLDEWQIIFDSGLLLQISWQETPARVLLYCAIGTPVESQREKIFARLLNMNLLLQGVANLKLALSSPEDDVILIGEIDPAVISLEVLKEEITEYLGYAARFSELINEPETAGQEADFAFATNTELLRA